MDEKSIGRVIGYGILGIILIVVFFGSFVVIDPGHKGLVVHLGQLSDTTLDNGFHFKMPIITHIEDVSVQTQTTKFDNMKGAGDSGEQSSLFAASKDLQDVQIATVVNWHVDNAHVLDIYRQYQGMDNYTASVIEPIIRNSVKSISALYTAEELVQKREQFSNDVSKDLALQLTEKGAVLEQVNIVNFEFSGTFTKAIEAKVVAEQDALAAKNKLAQVEYEAQQRKAQAQGEADAIAIQSQAIKQGGGADYVKLQWIDAWKSGGAHVPNTILGSGAGNFLLNIGGQ